MLNRLRHLYSEPRGSAGASARWCRRRASARSARSASAAWPWGRSPQGRRARAGGCLPFNNTRTATRQRDRLHAREGGGVQREGAQLRQVYPSALSTLLRFSDSAVWRLQLSPSSITVSSAGTTPHARFPLPRESNTSSPSLAVLRPSCSVVSMGFFSTLIVAFVKQSF